MLFIVVKTPLLITTKYFFKLPVIIVFLNMLFLIYKGLSGQTEFKLVRTFTN